MLQSGTLRVYRSYAGAKIIDKAEELNERTNESDLCFTAVTYNEMMTLYMSVVKLKRVAYVVYELKDRNFAHYISSLTRYNLWISSCAANVDIDEAQRVLDEMSSCPGRKLAMLTG
ncbi:Pentatricopeptide repeat-containing protein At5g09450, mitochondrial [Linum perenne]